MNITMTFEIKKELFTCQEFVKSENKKLKSLKMMLEINNVKQSNYTF